MAERPAVARMKDDRAAMVVSALMLALVLALLGGLLVLVVFGRSATAPGSAAGSSASSSVLSFYYPEIRAAPPIDLIDPDGRPFSLGSLRGQQVLVFFGYTHCPDVCPATIGNVSEVLGKVGPGTRAVFASIDPQRDTTRWLQEYVRFMPAGFVALTGSPAQVRTTADAWGVRYARVETGSKDAYSMSHTADVYLVDAAGQLRAHFPFGTDPQAMIRTLRAVAASTPVSTRPAYPLPAPTPSTPVSTPASSGGLRPEVVSTSVWAGPQTPVILALNDETGRLNDTSIGASVQLTSPDGKAVGSPTAAVAVRPPEVDQVSYVTTLEIPQPGPWRLEVTTLSGGRTLSGSVAITALDPGESAALGAPAPSVHTPTLDDVGGDARAVTTDPAPYLQLSGRSTTDALAAHAPFVLVIDSSRFRVSPACGKALIMARYLVYRWSDVVFIHLEPFRYRLISDTPVLAGDISDPPMSPIASAWGVGGPPWGGLSMPWVFVVDADGVVRAKYQGLIGSDDVDVMLSLISGATATSSSAP